MKKVLIQIGNWFLKVFRILKNVFFKVLNWFLDLFGFRRNNAYVKTYLNGANMRSGVFMAGIIVILEIWLVIRQHDKYIIPAMSSDTSEGMAKIQNYFSVAFNNTSLFWLFMVMGISMLLYCFFYDRKKTLANTIAVIVASGLGIVLCCLFPFEKSIQSWNNKYYMSNSLLIALYLSIFIFHVTTIVSTILQYRGKKMEWLNSVVIISLFALCCLIFGVRVSYNDYFSTSSNKQIICFLMFVIYVGCLLIWKPYVSISLLGAVFLGFYFMLKYAKTGNLREWSDGDEVNYLTFYISLAMVCVSIYSQRVAEAKKDEELELLATRDTLTGLYAFEYFLTLTKRRATKETNTEFMYLFLDITSFKIFNDQRGFKAGNEFLRNVGEILTKEFPDGLISRQSDDHYVVFTPNKDVDKELERIEEQVEKLDLDIRPGVKVGGYILKNIQEDPHRSVEKARYACAELKQRGRSEYLEYDQKMHDIYHLNQYIVRHVDEAIENGYIKAYYQPVVWSENNELCGCEALCRWIDPRYGFLNPGQFISTLERAQLIHKLDVAMLRLVCKDLRYNMDNNLPVVPVSINFSRLDFMVMDVPEVIESIVNEYNIPKDFIHVEVTESALLEEGSLLKDAMKRLKEKGFALWLDDFGSGYSSFNALKDYDFDVLKLDMQFLVGFGENQKSKALIQSVISMASKVGMKTLSEGVETKEQAEFLKSISCGRLQGYLFGKPYSYDDLKERIKKGEFVISKKVN